MIATRIGALFALRFGAFPDFLSILGALTALCVPLGIRILLGLGPRRPTRVLRIVLFWGIVLALVLVYLTILR